MQTTQQARSILFPGMFSAQREQTPALPLPIARRTDPVTSKLAAKNLTASGGRESAQQRVLEFLESLTYGSPFTNPELTSAEISRDSGIPHPTVHKRLPDLRVAGRVINGVPRKCRVTGNLSLTWRIKP